MNSRKAICSAIPAIISFVWVFFSYLFFASKGLNIAPLDFLLKLPYALANRFVYTSFLKEILAANNGDIVPFVAFTICFLSLLVFYLISLFFGKIRTSVS